MAAAVGFLRAQRRPLLEWESERMSFTNAGGTMFLAVIVVIGTFIYILTVTILGRPTDPTVLPIIAGALGTVLSYVFAQHLSNSAATTAVSSAIESNRAQQTAVNDATAAAKDAPTNIKGLGGTP